MSRLAASSTDRPETVRVLFFGQTITKQNWWHKVAADLRARFPGANLRIENRSIGGYSTQFLIRTMEADILAFHPDPIVFHDYGAEALYEEIIRWIRSHTTAEVLLQGDMWCGSLAMKTRPAAAAKAWICRNWPKSMASVQSIFVEAGTSI